MNYILLTLAIIIHPLISALPSFREWLLYKRFNFNIKLKTLAEILMIVAATNVIIPLRIGGPLIKTVILKKRFSIPPKLI